MGFTFVGLDHVQIAAPPGCEEAARAFYGGVLALPEVPKPPVLAARGGVWFVCGAHQLHVGVENDFQPARKAHPAFLVEDLSAVRAHLVASGVSYEDDNNNPGVDRLYVFDPFGNRLEFIDTPHA